MPPAPPGPDRTRFSIRYVIVALLGIILLQDVWSRMQGVTPLPYSQFQQLLEEKQDRGGVRLGQRDPGHASRRADRRQEAVRHQPGRARAGPAAGQTRRQIRRAAATARSWPPCCRTCCRCVLFFGVWMFIMRRMAEQDRAGRRPDVDRQEQGQGLRRDRHQGVVQGRGRGRRGQRRAGGGGLLPQGSQEVRPPGRAHAQGRVADRSARHRQDPAGAGGGRRGRGAVLLDQRLGVRRDVRRRGRRPRARSVRAGAR